jgi:2-keto-4-pentenoate hydratase
MTFGVEDAARILFANAQEPDPSSEVLSSLKAYEGADMRDGFELQLAVLEHWKKRGDTVGGYKAGMTSLDARDSLGVGFRPFGYILASRMIQSGAVIERSRIFGGSLEQEICLILGRSLSGENVTAVEARDAVAAVAPAFEIAESRMPQELRRIPSVRIGNGLNNWGIVVGPEHDTDLDLQSLTVEVFKDGAHFDSGNSSQAVVDDPYLSLARICGELARYGLGLQAGMRVITGLLGKAPSIEVGKFTASFGAIGEVSITFV